MTIYYIIVIFYSHLRLTHQATPTNASICPPPVKQNNIAMRNTIYFIPLAKPWRSYHYTSWRFRLLYLSIYNSNLSYIINVRIRIMFSSPELPDISPNSYFTHKLKYTATPYVTNYYIMNKMHKACYNGVGLIY